MERRAAASGGGAFEATVAGRLALRKYHAPPAIKMSSAAIPAASGASRETLLRRGRLLAGFAVARLRLRRAADFQRIDPDRLGDVLELRRAEIGDREIEPPLHLPVGVLGEADRAGLGDRLQGARRY